ncbi:protein phosphatase 2C domain-containing protein [Terrisporobacter sp.]|uniref:protein phosphatase 2C domain-containing protein n=1 Tax=Terrisporobacter sp. TaxID=1965305 RepID=UPI0026211C91|nr:protein phosphatase 2C domain-containing protein [Terrisporobacter sp.]
MIFTVFSKSIVGYKNKIKNKSSQDYVKYETLEEGIICAVADGHSGDFFTHSHKGSEYACEAVIEVLKKYIIYDLDDLDILLKEKKIQKEICVRWRELVEKDFDRSLPRAYKLNYFRYGTTLLATVVTDKYRLFFKLGDGEILINKNKIFNKVLYSHKKYLVDCMAEEEAHNKFLWKLEENVDIGGYFIILYSDGYENSFSSYEYMIEDLNDTLTKYNKNIFAKLILEMNYEDYLERLSEKGSRDDISIIFVNVL